MLGDGLPSDPAREAKFRVQVPNSKARDILVVPLDAASETSAALLAAETWRNARFVAFSAQGQGWREAIERAGLDLVVMIGTVGQDLSQAIPLGEGCIERNIKTSGVLLRPLDVPLAEFSSALRSVRPWTQTLAIISEADYLPGLLHALGA